MATLLKPDGTWELVSPAETDDYGSSILSDDGTWVPIVPDTVVSADATINAYLAGSFQAKPLKRWTGSAWEAVPAARFKYWNGAWTQVP